MRLNIGLPGPFSTSTNVNGKGCAQGLLGMTIIIVGLLLLCCCVGTVGAACDDLTGKNTVTTENTPH